MLFLIILLAGAGVWVEMKLVKEVPFAGQFLERYRLLSLGFSLALSIGLGSLFGAAGLIVFAAGILSTVAIQPWYAMRANGTIARMQRYINSRREEVMTRLNQLAKLAIFIGKMIVLPIVLFFKILDFIENVTDKLTHERSM